MMEFFKIVSRVTIILILCSTWLNSIECADDWIPPLGFEQKQMNPAYVPPASNSSSTSNYNNYNNNRLIMEELLLTKEAYPRTESFKNNDITIRLGIVNNKDYSLENSYLFDKIEKPFVIDAHSFRIDQGPDSNNLEYQLLDLSKHPGQNQTSYQNAAYDKKEKYILTLYPKGDRVNLTIKQFNSSEMLYLSYNITTNISGKYSLQPFRLFSSDYFEGKKILQSNPLFIDVVDHNPVIDSIKIKPNPAKKDEIVNICAKISDSDGSDLDRCELFSSIDGNLDDLKSLKNSSNSYSYYYRKNLSGLSEGSHLITLKVFDKDGQTAYETLNLNVDNYIFWIPSTYF